MATTTAHSRMVHVRVDDEIKEKAGDILGAVGLSLSEAVRLFLHRVVLENGYPLELKLPNAQTRRAIDEADEILRKGLAISMAPEEVIDELEKGRRKIGHN